MREVLDRLREAETALDSRLNDAYFLPDSSNRTGIIALLWKAKQGVWLATMHMLCAATIGCPTDEP